MLVEAQHVGMGEMNKQWFVDRLRTIKLSQRQLAKQIGVDPASVSYMFSGKRRITMDEAQRIAGILLVPVTEVMRQAGIDVMDDVRKVPVSGYIGAGCNVTLLPNGTHDMVMAPADTPSGCFALQMRMVNSPGDGWLYFVEGSQQAPDTLLDKLCMAAIKDGRLLIGVLRRGYKRELHNLILACGPEQEVLENREVIWASRALWIQPT
jgi:hypothetical protein